MNKVIKSTLHDIGPFKTTQLFFPVSGIHAYVVIDNVALGPSIGGVRVSPHVTLGEVKRLARTMTMKNSIAGLPHGGGKAGIVIDPRSPDKERIFRIFAQAIGEMYEYIPGPDMGSDEGCMAWIHDEIKRAVGLPEEMGGLALDKLGATGFGIAECTGVSCRYAKIKLKGARVAIQGFGSVGKAAAKSLSERGAIVVAVSDTQGSTYDPDGIDLEDLLRTKQESGSVIHYKKGTVRTCEELFTAACDVLIPAAIPDVLHKDNAEQIAAKRILQGANIPATREAEEILHKRGILSIPDFIVNAGGVIMAAMEYAKKTEGEAFDAIAERIKMNTDLILEKSYRENILPRDAAEGIAKKRVLEAMSYQRVS